MLHTRREFLASCSSAMAGCLFFNGARIQDNNGIMTVNGWLKPHAAGISLIHEHVMVDFIGADKVDPSRYNADEVFRIALPKLMEAKSRGCVTMMECTPAYIGRDVRLLQRLSNASGINLVTNTGYYGASSEKFFPAHAHTESARQLADRWIAEWLHGIDNTNIKPGFIKSGVDKLPFTPTQTKIIEAAAITHLATGLTIGIHTGNGDAALKEKEIIQSNGVDASAWIWIHAQNEKDHAYHIQIAKEGGWISYDGVNNDTIDDCISLLKDMQQNRLLHQVLLSHDSGWFNVGTPNGGTFNGYTTIFDKLLPAMKKNGFTQEDIHQLLVVNPANAYPIRIRRSK